MVNLGVLVMLVIVLVRLLLNSAMWLLNLLMFGIVLLN